MKSGKQLEIAAVQFMLAHRCARSAAIKRPKSLAACRELLGFSFLKTHPAFAARPAAKYGPSPLFAALAHDAVLVNNNDREFRRVPGLVVESWYEEDLPN